MSSDSGISHRVYSRQMSPRKLFFDNLKFGLTDVGTIGLMVEPYEQRYRYAH
jgi:hypothetical protein